MKGKLSAAHRSTCPMNYPSFIFRMLTQDGHPAEMLLAGTGLSADALEEPHGRLEHTSLQRLVRNALDQTGDPHLGLRLAQRFEPQFIGLPAFAAMSAPSFTDGLQVLDRFFSLIFSAIEFTFPDEEAGTGKGEVAIRISPIFDLGDAEYFVSGSALAGCAGLLNALLRTDQAIIRAEMTGREPDSWAEIAADIGFPIRFNCAETRLFIPKALLDQPLPGADPINHPQLLALCEELAASAGTDETPWKRVQRFLEDGDNLSMSLGETAAALGYSERGLRRHLEAAGTSFRRLVNEVRKARAREMLRKSSRPISLIAQDLGYDTPSNFARSFKRWTGMTPKAFRDAGGSPQNPGQI